MRDNSGPDSLGRRVLGASDVIVSRLSLGTATFGVSPAEAAVAGLIDGAIAEGIAHFDCANSYGDQPDYDRVGHAPWHDRPSAEELLGRALQRHHGTTGISVSSKVGEPLGEERQGSTWRGHLDRGHILEQAHRSRDRLRRAQIDLYYAHLPDPTTPLEETVDAFAELIDLGVIRAWGVSNFSAQQTTEIVQTARASQVPVPVVHQAPYSIAKRGIEQDLLPSLSRVGMDLIAHSPLGMGLLAGAGATTHPHAGSARWGGSGFSLDEQRIALRFQELAYEHARSPAETAIAWLLRSQCVSVVVGASKAEHLKEAARGADVPLTAEHLRAIEELFPAPPITHAYQRPNDPPREEKGP